MNKHFVLVQDGDLYVHTARLLGVDGDWREVCADSPEEALRLVSAEIEQEHRAKMVAVLGEAEMSVVDSLTKAWNAFANLAPQHPDDADEFRRAVHAAKYIVMARAARPCIRDKNAANEPKPA